MASVELKNINKVHFTGIGGVSMSGLAEILHTKGFRVSGSDLKESRLTGHLADLGIQVMIGQRGENIAPDLDLVVYTSAVKQDNPELLAAASYGVPAIDRAALLGMIMKEFQYPISIAGTHGKTTTTSLVSEIFLAAGKDPTVSVGGVLNTIGGNFRMGKSGYFVVESCEYFDSFLKFFPYAGIILNVERDHIDYFKTMAQLENSFNQFARNIHAQGCLVINAEMESLHRITAGVACEIILFGDSARGYGAENIVYDQKGNSTFDVYYKGTYRYKIKLNVSGVHNILNALAACATAEFFGVAPEAIQKGLGHFTGADRRFEYKGEVNGATIIDDYAHHPTEISTTLEAARKVAHHKLYCVFQPHTYTRTKAFLEEFAQALSQADEVILLDIYSAREQDDLGIHSRDLAARVRALGTEVHYFPAFDEAEIYLLKKCFPKDLLITMGAGDVHLVGEHMLSTDLSTLSTDF